jgi:RNA polymerase sigma factor (sigma-70 family)
VKQIVFTHYLPWVRKEYTQFCETNEAVLGYFHFNTIGQKHRKRVDLYKSACLGFSKALKNFNGNSSTLTRYAVPYIQRELYNEITIATEQSRRREYIENRLMPVGKNRISFLHHKTNYEKYIEKNIDNRELVDVIDNLPYQERALLNYRYDIPAMKKIRSVTEVSKLMNFSVETYRKKHRSAILTVLTSFRG